MPEYAVGVPQGSSRNARCPCGSGLRYKDCHGALPRAEEPALALAALERRIADAPQDESLWVQALELTVNRGIADADVGRGYTVAGSPPLAVAVVTAYAREDIALIRRAHESVLAQTYPCRHFLVADGYARREIDGWNAEHLELETPHRDYGDTPRATGGLAAAERGFDAVAYLDADSTFRPRHVESLVARQQETSAGACYSGRTLHLPDGTLVPAWAAEDATRHIDTSCYFFARPAFSMLDAWTRYPRIFSPIGDRVLRLMLLARGLVIRCTGAMTLRFTGYLRSYYAMAGRPAPGDAREPLDLAPLYAWYRGLSPSEREAVDELLGFPFDALAPAPAASPAR